MGTLDRTCDPVVAQMDLLLPKSQTPMTSLDLVVVGSMKGDNQWTKYDQALKGNIKSSTCMSWLGRVESWLKRTVKSQKSSLKIYFFNYKFSWINMYKQFYSTRSQNINIKTSQTYKKRKHAEAKNVINLQMICYSFFAVFNLNFDQCRYGMFVPRFPCPNIKKNSFEISCYT